MRASRARTASPAVARAVAASAGAGVPGCTVNRARTVPVPPG